LDISPHLALNYSLTSEHTLRFSVSRAVRTPVMLEEMANQRFAVGNDFVQEFAATGGLDSEKITALDLGYLGRFPDAGISVDARLFYSHITELITYYVRPYPQSLPGITLDFRNGDDLLIRGFETQVQFQPVEASRLIVNYAYTRLTGSDVDEEYSKSGPRHNFSLLGIQQLPANYQASIGFYYMSDYDGVDTGTHIPVTRRLDLRLAKSWELSHNRRLEGSITLQSVLGEYQDFRSVNTFDTRAYLKLRFWF
ncbi:MAG TPA: TonB-dependent receptor, partial [Gammaproteobacteria bacterium]|nr:TonB-dependent receptor [Gammaproteobacteria bacterium]